MFAIIVTAFPNEAPTNMLYSKVNRYAYPQTLDKDVKVCQGQTL